jgi:hypothetical protein
MNPKEVAIMIERGADGRWHVVVHVNGALVERSPAFQDRDIARRMAEIVSERFEAQFHRVNGKWKRTT